MWDIDGNYKNNLAKNQVSAFFHSRVIRRTVSLKFIELFMESCSCLYEDVHVCALRRGTSMAALGKITKASVIEFSY